MDKQTFIQMLQDHAFLTVELRDELLAMAEDASAEELKTMVAFLEDLNSQEAAVFTDEKRNVYGIKKGIQRDTREHQESEERDEELRNLPSFDDA